MRNGYSLQVNANSKRRNFKFDEDDIMYYEQPDSTAIVESRNIRDVIFVDADINKDADLDRTITFNPSGMFRLLDPQVPSLPERRELLRDAIHAGSLYCMGIFADRRENLLFGYDVSHKGFVQCRDRNTVTRKGRRDLIHRVCKESGCTFIGLLLDKIIAVREEKPCDEMDALLKEKDTDISREIASMLVGSFQAKYGDATFPCNDHECDQFKKTFSNREPRVLCSSAVNVLRNGGLNDIKDELERVFSVENNVLVGEDGEALIRSVITRLSRVNIKLDQEHFVFIDGSSLKKRCKHKEGGVFYISNSYLSLTLEQSMLRVSNRLGHEIVTIMETECNDTDCENLAFCYTENNDSTTPEYVFQWNDEGQVKVCAKLLGVATEVQVCTTSNKVSIPLLSTEFCISIPMILLS